MNKKMPMIALVDDDRNILTSVGMALEAEGYSVQKYNDGAAALQGLQDQPPDMAIFDIKMPRMDAWSCCAASARKPIFQSSS